MHVTPYYMYYMHVTLYCMHVTPYYIYYMHVTLYCMHATPYTTSMYRTYRTPAPRVLAGV